MIWDGILNIIRQIRKTDDYSQCPRVEDIELIGLDDDDLTPYYVKERIARKTSEDQRIVKNLRLEMRAIADEHKRKIS
jgi:hypothetical protein